MPRRHPIYRSLATAACICVLALSSGCKRSSSTSASAGDEKPYVDPWQARLDSMRKEYEANEAKLLADWRTAMSEVASGDLDADRLSREVSELVRQVTESTTKLDNWNRELRSELSQRGSPGGPQ